MKVSVGYLDQLWSKAVKARDGHRCKVCGSVHGLESHHINIRKHFVTRWMIDNGITLCKSCHSDDAHNPLFLDICRDLLGKEVVDNQCMLSNKTLKGYCTELGISPNEFKLNKKAELKEMLDNVN